MPNRRDFIKYSTLLGAASIVPILADSVGAAQKESDFTLWQLPLNQTPSQGNSYVFQMKSGKVVVMDGGVPGETGYLRGFLGALGNRVEAWFLSHPHSDHIGAFNEILKKPDGIEIKSIYHSKFSEDFYNRVEPGCRDLTADCYRNMEKSGIDVQDITEPGGEIVIDRTRFRIMAVKNEEFTENAYNNSSMVIHVRDDVRSALFLGDAGEEEGDKILQGPLRNELDCDYLQMAHHGQRGVNDKFYRTVKFKACLWPTPRWLYDNNAGKGFDTHIWKTVHTRKLMEELGIEKHLVGCDGLQTVR